MSVAVSSSHEHLPITSSERDRLADLEQAIRSGFRAFIEVGTALLEIRDNRLYRESHPTFEAYCLDVWGLKQSRAYQLLEAAKVAGNLAVQSSTIVEVPANEAQVRPLVQLKSDQQREVWQEAVQTAPKGKVTAKHVQKTVDRKLGKPTPAPEPDPVIEPQEPAGKSKVNGQVAADPPDIAKARAAGRIGADVVVEITEPVQAEEPEADPEAPAEGEAELSDEDWLASLPARAGLADLSLKYFEADALIYRRLEKHRKTFQHHATRILNASRRKGPYAGRVSRFLKTDHPRHWLVCTAPENGGCGGSGLLPVLGQQCPKCYGKGYWIK
jgi:hypothetical protein